jgi:D-glycero-D-manno-heptose 1,7-bisphosphate phosphatase
MMRSHKAVFLDRDGVLNESIIRDGLPFSPASVAELTIPEDVKPALDILKSKGFLLIVVTNQPDVARGKAVQSTVDIMNQTLRDKLPLDDVYVCFHDDTDHCHCRKPLPGMLLDAAEKWDIDLSKSFMIGDRWKDIVAGQRAGCATILLQHNYLEQAAEKPADFTVGSLTEAAAIIAGAK